MYLSNRLYVITGLVLIAIAVTFVCQIGTSIAISDTDPTSKADTAKFLKDLVDNHTVAIVSLGFGVLLNGVLTVLISNLTFLVFRDRSRVLATTLLVAFVGSAVLSAVSGGIAASTIVLAKDYAHGGAGLNAGDPAILELTHVLQVIVSLIDSFGGTSLGIAFVALGWLIARAPAGNVNPPRALGWIIVVDGIASLVSWSGFATEAAGFLSFIVFGLTTLIFTLWLGIWLIKNSSTLPLPDAAGA